MAGTLDDAYLAWLYLQVGARSVRESDPSRTHWRLLRQMHETDFVWLVPNDDNRAADGLELRYEFMDEKAILPDRAWLERPCSFLEMLIGLARRLAFEGEGQPHVWFWHLIDNLDLTRCNDDRRWSPRRVDEIINSVIWRTYAPSGRGGLFPLRYSHEDQRDVELWYQMNAYLVNG